MGIRSFKNTDLIYHIFKQFTNVDNKNKSKKTYVFGKEWDIFFLFVNMYRETAGFIMNKEQ